MIDRLLPRYRISKWKDFRSIQLSQITVLGIFVPVSVSVHPITTSHILPQTLKMLCIHHSISIFMFLMHCFSLLHVSVHPITAYIIPHPISTSLIQTLESIKICCAYNLFSIFNNCLSCMIFGMKTGDGFEVDCLCLCDNRRWTWRCLMRGRLTQAAGSTFLCCCWFVSGWVRLGIEDNGIDGMR